LTDRYDLRERENVGFDLVFERSDLTDPRSNLTDPRSDLTEHPVSDLREPALKEWKEEVVEESLSPYPLTGSGVVERASSKMINPKSIHEAAEKVVRNLGVEFGAALEERTVRLVRKAVTEGLPPSRALAFLQSRATGNVHSPDRLHAANASDLPKPRPEDRPQWLLELCPSCNERGYTEDTSMCSADPAAIEGVCLHGEPDPWNGVTAPQRLQEDEIEKAFREARERQAEAKRKAMERALARRQEQRAKGIECVCTPLSMCEPCRISENRTPDLPESAWKYEPGYRPKERTA